MAQFDLPLDALRTYQPEVAEAPGFDAFGLRPSPRIPLRSCSRRP